MEAKRIAKVMAAAGIASRRHAEVMISEGRVKINGKLCLHPSDKVDIETDIVEVDDKQIEGFEEKQYFLLNKPAGYECTSREGRRTKKIVVNLFKNADARLFTVGRLDRDTTGLLIVTNDGHFANRVIHPSNNVEKEYLVKVTQEVEAEHLFALTKGCVVEDTFVKPKRVTKVRRGTIKIVVMEGKKREVRIMVKEAGLELVSLARIRMGDLTLGQLDEGCYRPLTEREKELLVR